jgi:hypothetical protein
MLKLRYSLLLRKSYVIQRRKFQFVTNSGETRQQHSQRLPYAFPPTHRNTKYLSSLRKLLNFRANPTDCDHSSCDCHPVYNERDAASKLDITSQVPLPQLLHWLLLCLGQEIELVILHSSSWPLTSDWSGITKLCNNGKGNVVPVLN